MSAVIRAEQAVAEARRAFRSLCGPCIVGQHTGPRRGGICECDCHAALIHPDTQETP